MVWKQETSGVISLSSAGSWIQNIMQRSHSSLPTTSFGGVAATFAGSDRVQLDLVVNE